MACLAQLQQHSTESGLCWCCGLAGGRSRQRVLVCARVCLCVGAGGMRLVRREIRTSMHAAENLLTVAFTTLSMVR